MKYLRLSGDRSLPNKWGRELDQDKYYMAQQDMLVIIKELIILLSG